jgi:cobalt-zinc-cadmium efflux system protein
VIGGILTGSVALLADAAHNIADGAAVAIALVAARLATRSASGRRTYGWGRVEILAALVNGVILVVLGVLILLDAASRIRTPTAVHGGVVAVFGAVGLTANGVAVVIMLRARPQRDLNLRGAFLHTAADAAASVGVLAAGLIITTTGWVRADPLIAIVIAVVILASSWPLLREPVEILLERAPAGIDPDAIGRRLCDESGVAEVHDLHVWRITSDFDALSVHVIAAANADTHELLHRLESVLHHDYAISHTTIQVDQDHSAPISLRRRARPRTSPVDVAHRPPKGRT